MCVACVQSHIIEMSCYVPVCRSLCDRLSARPDVQLQDILLEWQRVSWWKWAGQMSSQVDRDRYWDLLSHSLRKFLDQDIMVRRTIRAH